MTRRAVSLVVGADGLIGRALSDHLVSKGETVLETTRRPNTVSGRKVVLDLSIDVSAWHPPCQVSVAYLCAAASSLEYCQRCPAQSATLNVHNTVALAKSLAASGAFTVFPSTNLVYDGSVPFRKADDPVCPQTEYGRQKAEAERQLLALGDCLAVVRITKVLGPNLSPFREWIRALQDQDGIHPFSDMVMAPLPLPFVVDVLYRTAERRLPGIVQVSGEKDITYEQVARHVAGRLAARPELVQPVRARETHSQLGPIPSYTTLDTSRLLMELGIKPPDVWSVIDSMIHQTLELASSSERE